MNGSTTLRLDAGPIALAGRGHSIIQLFGQTRRTSPADGTHGDPAESREQPEHSKLLRTCLTAPNSSQSQCRKSILDGVTPPPTDKSGRGGKIIDKIRLSKLSPGSTSPTKKGATPNKTSPPTERRTNKLWHRKREVENPNRKRSPEQEADKTRSS
ncbi:hypothetical protein J6590_090403 [Homalodisca vitripennis]|nr:hypothetical protein J6590_090403 [Homalodisca vitripennis]